MKKILLVAGNGLGKAGVPTFIMNIVRNLHDRYTIDILLFTKDIRYYDKEFESYGGKIFRCPHYSGDSEFQRRIDIYIRGMRIYRAAKKIFKENGPYDAVHCNNYFESCNILKAAFEEKIPVRIAHAHDVINTKGHVLRTAFNKLCRKSIIKYATKCIACSQDAGESIFGISADFGVMSNPYDDKRFYLKSENKEFDCPSFVQVGRYGQKKNQLFSLKVLKYVLKKYSNAKISFIGYDSSNIYITHMKRYIAENSLSDNVVFYEHNTDIPTIMSETPYFLFPSHYEGFGIVLIEAQAMGLTCYVSDAVPTLANVGGCKYLSLDEGPKAWAERIISDFEKDKGAHHNYDCLSFTSENVAKTYDKLYRGENI